MIVNKNSWHYKLIKQPLFKERSGADMPSNSCAYVRSFLFSLLKHYGFLLFVIIAGTSLLAMDVQYAYIKWFNYTHGENLMFDPDILMPFDFLALPEYLKITVAFYGVMMLLLFLAQFALLALGAILVVGVILFLVSELIEKKLNLSDKLRDLLDSSPLSQKAEFKESKICKKVQYK